MFPIDGRTGRFIPSPVDQDEENTVLVSDERSVNDISNVNSIEVPQSSDIQEIKANDDSLPISEEEIKNMIFDSLKSGELEILRTQLTPLDPLQKSKYFASSMKFQTSWASGEEKMTPLQYACFLGHIEGVELLIELGASANDFCDTSNSTQRGAIHFAIDGEHYSVALLLISKGAKDQVASCETSHAFSKYKLPVEWDGNWTCLSALHMAIIKNAHDLARELLLNGNAKISEKASGNNSPLHLAARSGDEEMIDLLLSFGANSTRNLKNSNGKTPKDLAQNNKHDHLLALLS